MYKSSARHKTKHQDYDLYADLEKIKSALGDTARDVRGVASDMLTHSFENAREKTSFVQDNVTEYIQNKPFKSVGLAVLGGIVIGILWRRK